MFVGAFQEEERAAVVGANVRNFAIQEIRPAQVKGGNANSRQVTGADHRLSSFGVTDASFRARGNARPGEGNRRRHSGRHPGDLSASGAARNIAANRRGFVFHPETRTYGPTVRAPGTDDAGRYLVDNECQDRDEGTVYRKRLLGLG